MVWLLLGYVILPAPNKASVSSQLPKLAGAVLVTVLLIASHHLFLSQSKDSSFSVSLVLVTLPLVMLFSAGLGERAFSVLFWVCAAFAGYAAARYLWLGERAYVPLLDPGVFATLLYLAWIPWTHRRLRPGSDQTIGLAAVLGGLAFVFSLALLATHSRFSILAIGLVVSGWWLLSLWQACARRALISVSLGVLLGAVAYIGFTPEDMPTIFADPAVAGADASASPRWLLLNSAGEMGMAEMPGLGVGLYGFSLLYPRYRSVDEQDTLGLFAHNDFVQIAVEGGFLLLLPLLALVGWTLFNGGRLALQRGAWAERLGYWLAASVALLHATVNFVFYILALVVLLGAVLGAAVGHQTAPPPRSERIRLSLWTPMVILGVLIILAFDSVTYAVFSGHGGVPGANAIRQDPARMLSWADFAARVNDDRSVPRLALAQLYSHEHVVAAAGLAQKTKADIAQLYSEAIAIDPSNPYAYVAFADYLEKNGGRAEAPEALRLRAWALAPQDPEIASVLVRFYVNKGATDQALEIAEESMRWCELQARRSRGAQYEFLQTVTRLGLKVQGLKACRGHYEKAILGRRAPPPLLKYFKSTS